MVIERNDRSHGLEKELNKPKRRLLYVPLSGFEGQGFFPLAISKFDPNLLRKNIVYLRNFDTNLIAESQEKVRFLKIRERIVNDYQLFSHRIDGLAGSLDIRQTLISKVPNIKILDSSQSPEEVRKILQRELRGSEDIVLGSDSHLITYLALEALGVKNVGLVVIDRHSDFYNTEGDELVKESKLEIKVNKANFLIPLLDKKIAGAVSIWGLSDDWIHELTTGQIKDQIYNPMTKVYKEYRERILLTSHQTVSKNKKDLKTFVKQQLDLFKRQGVTRLFFSVDVDGFRAEELGYTAMEYNPKSYMALLGIQNLEWVEEVGLEYRARKLLEALSDIILPVPAATEVLKARDPMFLTRGGLSLASGGQIIEGTKIFGKDLGIEAGILLEGGGLVLGDINEMAGLDYKGRVARAVRALVAKL